MILVSYTLELIAPSTGLIVETLEYEWDEVKRLANIHKHKVDFYSVYEFEWNTALIQPSEGYAEPRLTATGKLKGRLHHLVYVIRGERRRVISFRIAKPKERKEYAER